MEVFEVNCRLLSKFIVNDLLPVVGPNYYPLNELMVMTAAVHRIRPTHIIEWGTNIGISARIFYETINKFEIDCKIHSIDLPDDTEHVEHSHAFRGQFVAGIDSVTLYQGDGLDIAIKIADSLTDARILFFVDGDHSYESVYNELDTLMTKYPNTNILIHDTFYQDSISGYNIGPFKAVQNTLSKHSTFSMVTTNLGGSGMTLLYNLPQIDHKLLEIQWV